MQTGVAPLESAGSAHARRKVERRAHETSDRAEDPLALWADLLLRLKTLLRVLALSEDQLSQVAWHVKARRYAAGEVIARAGDRAGMWALVVRGVVAVRFPPKSLRERLPAREPTTLMQPGHSFGEGMLLRGDPSPCTYRAASDVEVFVLRRPDLLSARRPWDEPGAIKTLRGDRPWVSPALLLVALLAVGAWLVSGALGEYLPRGRLMEPSPLLVLSEARIRLVSPLDGAVEMSEDLIQVKAVVTGRGVDRIELLVDDKAVASESVVSQSEGTTQELQLAWTGSTPGTRVLAIRGVGADGTTTNSDRVTVSVVPAGRLIFASNRNGVEAVYEMATDGTAVRLLTAGPGACGQPAASLDGDLAYVAEQGGLEPWLEWIPSGKVATAGLFPGRDPAWSGSGDRLAFSRGVEGVCQVFVARVADLTAWQLTVEEIYAGQPTWSPDETRLAYVAERDGNLDIWIAGIGGGEPVRLTEDPGTDWAPAWSPDGTHLAFVSDRSGQMQVYVCGIEAGCAPRQVTELTLGAESPAWSPDGYWLAVAGYSGDGAGVNSRELYLVGAAGGEAVRLTTNSYDDTHPVWVRR